jgi:hypothetical protein
MPVLHCTNVSFIGTKPEKVEVIENALFQSVTLSLCYCYHAVCIRKVWQKQMIAGRVMIACLHHCTCGVFE